MDFKAKRDALTTAQNELVGQINHIRGQLAIIDEPYNELDVIDWSIKTLKLADGDRDHMNQSAMTCTGSGVLVMTYDRAMALLLGAGLSWREADEIASAFL